MKTAKPRLASSNATPATRPPQAASYQSTSRLGTATYSKVKLAVVTASDANVYTMAPTTGNCSNRSDVAMNTVDDSVSETPISSGPNVMMAQ